MWHMPWHGPTTGMGTQQQDWMMTMGVVGDDQWCAWGTADVTHWENNRHRCMHRSATEVEVGVLRSIVGDVSLCLGGGCTLLQGTGGQMSLWLQPCWASRLHPGLVMGPDFGWESIESGGRESRWDKVVLWLMNARMSIWSLQHSKSLALTPRPYTGLGNHILDSQLLALTPRPNSGLGNHILSPSQL